MIVGFDPEYNFRHLSTLTDVWYNMDTYLSFAFHQIAKSTIGNEHWTLTNKFVRPAVRTM